MRRRRGRRQGRAPALLPEGRQDGAAGAQPRDRGAAQPGAAAHRQRRRVLRQEARARCGRGRLICAPLRTLPGHVDRKRTIPPGHQGRRVCQCCDNSIVSHVLPLSRHREYSEVFLQFMSFLNPGARPGRSRRAAGPKRTPGCPTPRAPAVTLRPRPHSPQAPSTAWRRRTRRTSR